MGLRHEKVASAFKRQISSIIHDELKDSRLGFVTVVRVEFSSDLRFARVYYTVFGEETQVKETRQVLEKATPFIRCLIGERMKLRFIPDINFKLDESIEYSIRIQKAIDKIKEEDEHK